ncbi:MAG: hypothetical protein AAFP86_21255, partial [Planctomycetota bacterium]
LSSENQRNWGWSIAMLSGFYAFATDDVRAGIRGQGAAADAGGRNWAQEVLDFLSYVTTPAGLTFCAYNSNDDLSWDESLMGATDVPGRRGAFARDTNAGSPGQVAVGQKWFMACFVNKGLEALLKAFSTGLVAGGFFDEILRWPRYFNDGCRAQGRPVQQRFSEYVFAGIDTAEFPDRGDAPLARLSAAEVSSGDETWIPSWVVDPPGSSQQIGDANTYRVQVKKSGWLADSAVWFYDDEAHEDFIRYPLGLEGVSGRALVNALAGVGLSNLGSTGGAAWYDPYSNESFVWSSAARELNRIS